MALKYKVYINGEGYISRALGAWATDLYLRKSNLKRGVAVSQC